MTELMPLTKTKSQKARARGNKRAPRITGAGAYDMGKLIKPLREALKPTIARALREGGTALGSLSGHPLGGSAGRFLGKKLSQLIGSGDYTTNEVSVNSLINPAKANPSASFGSDGSTIRIQRREFLGDVLSPSVAGTFTNYSYNINPGLRTTFPFLSQVAGNYEEYCFDGLVFEFVTSASPYVSTAALGTVIASMEYNAAGPAFTSKYTMENSANAISTRLDKNLMYGVECKNNSNVQNCYYVRQGTSTLPVTTTDMGVFQLAVASGTGVSTSAAIGELWVTYDVVLKRPLLTPGRLGILYSQRSGTLQASPLGTTVANASSLGALSNCTITSTTITFANMVIGDNLLLSVFYSGSTAAPTTTYALPAITVVGVTAFNGYLSDSANSINAPENGATTVKYGMQNSMWTVTAPTVTFTFGTAGVLPTSSASTTVTCVTFGNGYIAGTAW